MSVNTLTCASCASPFTPAAGTGLPQALQQRRKVLDDLGPIAAVGFGAGSPDEVCCRTLEGHRVGMLAIAHGRQREHLGPCPEQELADPSRTGMSRNMVRSSMVY